MFFLFVFKQETADEMRISDWSSDVCSSDLKHLLVHKQMLSNFDRYPLTFGPTVIEILSRLTDHLGGDVELYAKREDCNSGLALGGNKLRKLEYIVPAAIASGADPLVTISGLQ